MPAAPFFALGLIMPIDVFLSVPPIALDAVRYGLAALIVFLVYSRTRPSTKVSALDLVALLLILSGGVAVFKEAFFGGSLFIPVVSLVSALVAYLVIKARMHHRWLLLGFMAGCALSGLDIISQAAGLPYLACRANTVSDTRASASAARTWPRSWRWRPVSPSCPGRGKNAGSRFG